MLTLGAWLHDLDPFVVRFGSGFGIRWYGVAYVVGFVLAWLILHRLARRGRILLDAERVPDLILAIVVGTLVGGRLGYALLYQPALLVEFSSTFPWWGLLAINQGGMASHGGMVGIIIACWIFARSTKTPPLHIMDLMALVAPIGLFFGRVANFVNGELLGRVAAAPGAAAPWWSVKFPQELIDQFGQPTLDEERTLLTDPGLPPEELTAEQAIELQRALQLFRAEDEADLVNAANRVIDLIQQGDVEVHEMFMPLLTARHPSQIYQALAEGVLLGVVLWLIWAKPRRAGVIGAWFLIVYGMGRVATEFVRLPDSHLEVQRWLGLSRGQWLSGVMVIAGGALLAWVIRKGKGDTIGGWRGRARARHAESENVSGSGEESTTDRSDASV